jgi:hypothetical protein
MKKYAPTPWKLSSNEWGWSVHSADGMLIFEGYESKELLVKIARAVNAYEKNMKLKAITKTRKT